MPERGRSDGAALPKFRKISNNGSLLRLLITLSVRREPGSTRGAAAYSNDV